MRSFFRALTTALLVSLACSAPAQITWPWTPRGYSETISSAGHAVCIERFNPSGCTGCYPAVIVLHGFDGMTRHGEQYRKAGQQLAANGYVAFLVHYFSGTPGISNPKQMDPKQFRVWMRNVSDTISYAASQPNVDPSRIGVIGFSLGAFVGLSVSATDPRVDALVEFAGGLPKEFAANAGKLPPTLIVHGNCDDVVPVTEACRLQAMLNKYGIPNYSVFYPGQGHILDKWAVRDMAGQVRCFLGTHLKCLPSQPVLAQR